MMLSAAFDFISTTQAADNAQAELPPPLDITAAHPLVADAPNSTIPRESGASSPGVPIAQPAAGVAEPPLDIMRFVNLGQVTFLSNKWEISNADKRTLDHAAAYLTANPGAARLLLDGNTDSIGGIKFNDTLSDRRAMAVQTYLLSKGVEPNLIHWKGYGKRAPVDENWTRLGRDRNRQVELYAVYLPSPDVGYR